MDLRFRNRILIGGFSQGATVALHALFSSPDPLAGCLALSSFIRRQGMPEETEEAEKDESKKLKTPVLQCHGTDDQMIEIKWGRETRDILKSRVADVRYHEMQGMGHEATPDEMEIVRQFINERTPDK